MNRRDFFSLTLGAVAFAAFRRKREILQRDQSVPGTIGTEDYHDWLKSHKALVNSDAQQWPGHANSLRAYQHSKAQWVIEDHDTYLNLCQKNPSRLT
jgi:hypothetical protein